MSALKMDVATKLENIVSEITNNEKMLNSGSLVLTAQWTKNNYTVTYDANGHGIAPEPEEYEYESHIKTA